MTKLEEKNVTGGETAMLHLDDWGIVMNYLMIQLEKNLTWGSPKSKNIDYKVEHPVFSEDETGKPQISYIDQFPEPKICQRNFYRNFQIVWKKVRIK